MRTVIAALADRHLARCEAVALDASYGEPSALLVLLESDVPTLAVSPAGGLSALADALEARAVDGLHLFAAGTHATLELGGETYAPLRPTARQTRALARIAAMLAQAEGGGAVHLYGTPFGAGGEGRAAARALSRALGTAVAATPARGEDGDPQPAWTIEIAAPTVRRAPDRASASMAIEPTAPWIEDREGSPPTQRSSGADCSQADRAATGSDVDKACNSSMRSGGSRRREARNDGSPPALILADNAPVSNFSPAGDPFSILNADAFAPLSARALRGSGESAAIDEAAVRSQSNTELMPPDRRDGPTVAEDTMGSPTAAPHGEHRSHAAEPARPAMVLNPVPDASTAEAAAVRSVVSAPRSRHPALVVRALSLEAWFRAAPGVGERVLLDGGGPRLVIDGPRLVFAVPTPAGKRRAVADLSRLGIEDTAARLVHAIATVREDWACLYVEGALAATARLDGVGREWAVPHRRPQSVGFEGELGLARLYTRALASREVLANHRATRRDGKPTSGALWSSGPIEGNADRTADAPDKAADDPATVTKRVGEPDGGVTDARTLAPAAVTPDVQASSSTADLGPRVRRTSLLEPDDRAGFGARVKRVGAAEAMRASDRGRAQPAEDAVEPPSNDAPHQVVAPAWTVSASVSGLYALPTDDAETPTMRAAKAVPSPMRSAGAGSDSIEASEAGRGKGVERLIRPAQVANRSAKIDEVVKVELPRAGTLPPRGEPDRAARQSLAALGSTTATDFKRDAALGTNSAIRVSAASRTKHAPMPERADPIERAAAVDPEPRPAAIRVTPGERVRLNVTELSGCALIDAIAHWPVSLPAWLSLDGVTGVASGAVPAHAAGTRERIAIAVANRHGARATLALDLLVGAAAARADARPDPLDALEAAMRTAADAVPALRALVDAGRQAEGSREARA